MHREKSQYEVRCEGNDRRETYERVVATEVAEVD